MTRSQIPLAVRRQGLRGAARRRRPEDPQLRRMLATHMHCGEPMQLVGSGQGPVEGEETDDGGVLTYRCTCGFSFDETQG